MLQYYQSLFLQSSIHIEACVNVAKAEETQYGGVTGKGVLVAVIDSGIDIENGEFLDDLGKTRIKTLWDQKQTIHILTRKLTVYWKITGMEL